MKPKSRVVEGFPRTKRGYPTFVRNLAEPRETFQVWRIDVINS
jgi:hypothetical protein